MQVAGGGVEAWVQGLGLGFVGLGLRFQATQDERVVVVCGSLGWRLTIWGACEWWRCSGVVLRV
jgi:hypothetical protein